VKAINRNGEIMSGSRRSFGNEMAAGVMSYRNNQPRKRSGWRKKMWLKTENGEISSMKVAWRHQRRRQRNGVMKIISGKKNGIIENVYSSGRRRSAEIRKYQ
jgi:hypothetical protein